MEKTWSFKAMRDSLKSEGPKDNCINNPSFKAMDRPGEILKKKLRP